MPVSKPRITFLPDLDALATLGYDTDEDGQTLCGVGPARRLASLVERAARELSAVLTRGEWNAIADVMNGTADLYDYADSDVPALLMLKANLQDSPGIDRKWKIKLPDLLGKLDALTDTHGEAILCAVRWAWRNSQTWDHARDEWWLPAFRRLHARKGE